MSPVLALDTSVAVPFLVATHPFHDDVVRWAAGRVLSLPVHSCLETYAVLTRLPGDMRASPATAAEVIDRSFPTRLPMSAEAAQALPALLAAKGVAGGATYDALVALTAAGHDATLATRDSRASATYERVGVRVEFVD